MSDAAPAVGRAFTKNELLGYLAEVDAELPPGEDVKIAVVGGAAVMFLVPGRVTDDVDVISEGMPEVLRAVAARVGRRNGLRSDWINDAAKGGLPDLDPELDPVYLGERLSVFHASPQYLLATKLLAGRPIDVEDAVPLAAAAGITTSDEMLDLVQEAFPKAWQTPALQYRTETVAGAVADLLQSGADLPDSGVDV